jgi:dihydrodipicolinate synthase/N-acetylneuraminate lyase
VMALGGEGVISVVSNAVPRAMSALVECCAAGDFASARVLHRRLMPFMSAAFIESNPAPVKAALAMLGRAENKMFCVFRSSPSPTRSHPSYERHSSPREHSRRE